MRRSVRMLFLMSLLFSLMSVAAYAGTYEKPTASDVIRGVDYVVHVNNTAHNYTLCSLILSSSLTNTSTLLANVSGNTTAGAALEGQQNFSFTINTNAFEDANDYSFTTSCQNSTGNETSSRSSITLDNTNPTAPTSLTTTTQTSSSFTLSATVTGAQTTSCSMRFVDKSPIKEVSGTHTENTCSFAFTGVPSYNYRYEVTASDESNTTTSAPVSFSVATHSGGGNYVPPQAQAPLAVSSDSIPAKVRGAIMGLIAKIRGWFA